MGKLVWDEDGKRLYETGVDRGVLFPANDAGGYSKGVAWNGLTAVNESPSGAEVSPLYADNIKYLNLLSAEEISIGIEAYTYPEEFEECDGSAEIAPGVSIGQQNRKKFGFCYRTILGNDVDSNNHGYKLHLLYGCLAAPSERSFSTVNDSPEVITLSWEVTTTPVHVPGFKPTACVVIDSTRVNKEKLAKLEEVLYGSETVEARLPLPEEIISLVGVSAAG